MNQPFKIRKNKSQKDIKLSQDTHKFSTNHNNIIYQNCNTQIDGKNLSKMTVLQPLKSKRNIIQNYTKKGQIRLDFTQPINLKKNNDPKLDSRYEYNLIGQDVNIHFKPLGKDKQNRPCSMNDLKYTNTIKVKQTFYNTQKSESLKLFPSITKNRLQNQTKLLKINEQIAKEHDFKVNKNKCSKYSTQISSKINKKQYKQILKLKTQSQQAQCKENKEHLSFRKTVLHQLLEKHKGNCLEKLDVNTCKPFYEQKFGDLSVIESNISQLQDHSETPMLTKQNSIFQVDCSTIHQKRQNQSSFISKMAINDFIKPPLETTLPSIQDKTHVQKKKKLEIEKIRKKFPQNFFK